MIIIIITIMIIVIRHDNHDTHDNHDDHDNQTRVNCEFRVESRVSDTVMMIMIIMISTITMIMMIIDDVHENLDHHNHGYQAELRIPVGKPGLRHKRQIVGLQLAISKLCFANIIIIKYK